MDNEKIGKFIAKLRKSKNLTQQELGDLVGVGGKSVSKWERGINMPDVSIINEVSKILGITSDELLKGEFDKKSTNEEYKKRKNKRRFGVARKRGRQIAARRGRYHRRGFLRRRRQKIKTNSNFGRLNTKGRKYGSNSVQGKPVGEGSGNKNEGDNRPYGGRRR